MLLVVPFVMIAILIAFVFSSSSSLDDCLSMVLCRLLSGERLSDALAVINDKLTLLAVDDVADNRATNAQAGDREATNAANSIDM